MTTPFSKYEILGRVVDAVNYLPTDAPILQMCNVIAGSIYKYLQELEIPTPVTLGKPAVVKAPATDIFDTEHVDDIPAEIKPKKTEKPKYNFERYHPTDSKTESVVTPAPRTTPVLLERGPDGLPIPDILWCESSIDLKNNYLGQYSNPCTTSLGKCKQPCVQTELWLFDKKTDELTTVDVEFADLETLHSSLDPYVEYAKKHRTPPVYVDKEINDAMDDLAAAAKELRSFRTAQDEKLKVDTRPTEIDGKTRIEQFLNLYNRGFKTSQIAREMGISEQYVYNLKNQAKNKGLIK